MTFLVGRDTYDAHVETFTGNASTTAFTLANSTTTNACVVRINGVVQRNGTDFTVSGDTITFSTAPPNASNNVVVQYFGVGTLQVPTDASVTEAKMGSDSVSEAKLKVSNSPTNGTFLQAQSGASGGLTWAEAGGGWEFVSTQTASGVAQIDFTNMTTGYDWRYEVVGVQPATDATPLKALLGVSGPTYRTSGYAFQASGGSQGSTAYNTYAYTNEIRIQHSNQGNAGDEKGVNEFTLFDPMNASTDTYCIGHGWFINGSGTEYGTGIFGGLYTTSEAHPAIRFLYFSGNIASGFFNQYRRANS